MEHSNEKVSIHSAIRKLESGKLNLNPTYQRNSVWTKSQKQLLIDSLLSGIPVPAIYWNKVDQNKIDVVDGQQRLRAISEFKKDEFRLDEDSNYGAKLYSELSEENIDLIDDYQLSIIYLYNWSDEQIEDMFLRLQDGSPLNAAEKRRAIQGTFRDVVKEISLLPFFENRVNFNNDRYGFEDAVAKTLHLHINGFTGISASKIKETYKKNNKIKVDDPKPRSLKKSLLFLERGFKSIDVSPQIKKWSSISLPLVILDLMENYNISKFEKRFAEEFMNLEEARMLEREKNEEDQDPRLINFNDFARADDPSRLESRHKFLCKWFVERIENLETIERDSQRNFTRLQKAILYNRSGGKCEMCKTDISQDNFDADHIIKHSEGGKTSLSNGRALCINCNRSRK